MTRLPDGPGGATFRLDPVAAPISNAIVDWYYTTEADMGLFSDVVDGVEPAPQAVIDSVVAAAKAKVYGGHWGVYPEEV